MADATLGRRHDKLTARQARKKARETRKEDFMSGDEALTIRPRGPSGEGKPTFKTEPPKVRSDAGAAGAKPMEQQGTGSGVAGGKSTRSRKAAMEMEDFTNAISPKRAKKT